MNASSIPTIADQLREGFALQQSGALDQAAAVYHKVLERDPRQFGALHLLGVIAAQRGAFAEAVTFMTRAIAVDPNHAGAHYNLGYALEDLRRFPEAIAAYDRAIALQPNHPVAYNNRGVALMALRDHAGARASFERALALAPDYAEAHHNRAMAQSDLGDFEGAIASFERALALKPDYDFLRGTLLYTRMRICDWSDLPRERAELCAKIAAGEKVSPPWPVLSLIDSPALQRRCAEIWARDKHPAAAPAPPLRAPADKIRIGYFSMDFRIHPVAVLAAGIFEHHDRAQFEITAFSFGVDTGDAMRLRLQSAFDRFIDVQDKTDAEIAALARGLGTDIAIDLGGYTTDSRAGIFAHRPAPVQIGALGFPATIGSPHLDYLLADAVVVPPEQRVHFCEKLIYLPHFQPNDRARPNAGKCPGRAELGLPETGFVYCCYNNSYKITPECFASWTRILAKVPGSVLWLPGGNAVAMRNLRAAAMSHGVDAARLIFAPHVSEADHFARQAAADLFLDTLPYNAHTTASDALWAGLPVLTCAGESYAARVAASVLNAAGLPELITASREAYEALAVKLAHDPARLADMRRQLTAARSGPLFEIASYTRGLEDAYRQVLARCRAGLTLDHIAVAAS